MITEDITPQVLTPQPINPEPIDTSEFINFEDLEGSVINVENSLDEDIIYPEINFSECNYQIEDIVSVKKEGNFEDEYVYDIEVADTHTFFANDILLHNSIYVEFGRITRQCHIPKDRQTQFVVDLWDYSLGPYMKRKYEEYAERYNCPKNIQDLELEKISDVTMYFAKKRYAMSECWKEPGIFLPRGKEVVYKGIEIVKGSTASYAKECMDDFTRYILEWYMDHDEPIEYSLVIDKLRGYKSQFMVKPPEEISGGASVGDYEKFILTDKNELKIGDKCPAHIRACGVYNYLLGRPKNKKYRTKYNRIKTADKVRWYYTTNKEFEVFAFVPGEYPAEFALEIDRNTQFEKTVLSYCNKIVNDILGYAPLSADLIYSDALF